MEVFFRIITIVLFITSTRSENYPTCGDCWYRFYIFTAWNISISSNAMIPYSRCIPDDNGTSSCPVDWIPSSSFSPATISAYLQQTPKSIYSLTCNPYVNTSCSTKPPQELLGVEDSVCAYKYDSETCGQYSMVTYPSTVAALEDNGVPTHSGSCGLCSTTQDLAIYLSTSCTHYLLL